MVVYQFNSLSEIWIYADVYGNNICCFHEGKWAEIIEKAEQKTAEQVANEKIFSVGVVAYTDELNRSNMPLLISKKQTQQEWAISMLENLHKVNIVSNIRKVLWY